MAGHGTEDAMAGLAEAKRNEFEDEKNLSLRDNVTSSVDHDIHYIHEGLEFPTEQERKTLRRVSDRIPWNAYCRFEARDPHKTNLDDSSSDCHH